MKSSKWGPYKANFITEFQINSKTFRFTLGKIHEIGKVLVTIGANPSTAGLSKSDPTVAKARKFAELGGYGGWVMLNLYPERSTDPKGVVEIDWIRWEDNLRHINQFFSNRFDYHFLLAWGDLAVGDTKLAEALQKTLKSLTQALNRHAKLGNLRSIGFTQNSQPFHLSRKGYYDPLDKLAIKPVSKGELNLMLKKLGIESKTKKED